MAEGKAKRTGMEVVMRQGSLDSVGKGKETWTIAYSSREGDQRGGRSPHESSGDGPRRGNRAAKGMEQWCRGT